MKKDMIRWGDVADLGFKAFEIFTPSSKRATGMYWKKCGFNVYFTNWQGQGGIFRLGARASKAFDAGKLCLVPPGCCSASGGPTREFSISRDVFPMTKAAFLKHIKDHA
jgi:hypothetical protein